MRYKNFKITNFRGIKNLEINDFSRINIFLGQNNCGKSSILEALFLLNASNNPQILLNLEALRTIFHDEEDDLRFSFYNLDYNNKVKLEAELVGKKAYRKLEIIPRKIILYKSRNSNIPTFPQAIGIGNVITEIKNLPPEILEIKNWGF